MIDKIFDIEEIYKTIVYRAEYQGKVLKFSFEQDKYNPQSRLKLISYNAIRAGEMSNDLISKLTDAIDEIEDFGNVTMLWGEIK